MLIDAGFRLGFGFLRSPLAAGDHQQLAAARMSQPDALAYIVEVLRMVLLHVEKQHPGCGRMLQLRSLRAVSFRKMNRDLVADGDWISCTALSRSASVAEIGRAEAGAGKKAHSGHEQPEAPSANAGSAPTGAPEE